MKHPFKATISNDITLLYLLQALRFSGVWDMEISLKD